MFCKRIHQEQIELASCVKSQVLPRNFGRGEMDIWNAEKGLIQITRGSNCNVLLICVRIHDSKLFSKKRYSPF